MHSKNKLIPPCLKKLLEKRWLLQQPQPPSSKLKQPPLLWVQYEESPQYLSRKNHSEIHITKIVDVYQNELPNMPDHLFIWPKREPDNPAESYSEYETDHSDYVEDDVEIPLETNLDEAAEFVDETLITHNLENIESGLIKIWDGFLMAASGYEDIRKELPNLDPVEVPQLMEQVPIPQLTEHSKPFQQLLSKTSEKTIISKICATIAE